MEKAEWCSYLQWKVWSYVWPFWHNTGMWWTDGHLATA